MCFFADSDDAMDLALGGLSGHREVYSVDRLAASASALLHHFLVVRYDRAYSVHVFRLHPREHAGECRIERGGTLFLRDLTIQQPPDNFSRFAPVDFHIGLSG